MALLACGVSLFGFFLPSPFRVLPFSGSPFGKPGFPSGNPFPQGTAKSANPSNALPCRREPFPGVPKCPKLMLKCISPPKVPPPLGIPKIAYFPSYFLQRLKPLSGLPRWTFGGPLGVPMVPPGSHMASKMAQNGHHNVSQEASRTENTECEQTILFAMF